MADPVHRPRDEEDPANHDDSFQWRAGLPGERVQELILGCVLPAGLGQAPARQAAIHSGLPPKVAAVTVNKVCGSGLKAVMLAAQGIATGDVDVVVAGGMESMSNCPYLMPRVRAPSASSAMTMPTR